MKIRFVKIAIFCTTLLSSIGAQALPSFAEQTEQACKVCHLNIGELTPAGREFKLKGYTQGNRVRPFSLTATASVTKVKSTTSSVDASVTMPKNGQLIPEEANLYVAGKFSDHIGGNLKWTASVAYKRAHMLGMIFFWMPVMCGLHSKRTWHRKLWHGA
jgi:hypothetical protein